MKKYWLQKFHPSLLNIGFFILFLSHCLCICTLIIDLKWPLDTSGPYPDINWFFNLLNHLCECIPAPQETGTVISSLLVVWTFISAIIIFYMEKKDVIYCGIRHWEIISFDIVKWMKWGGFIVYFTEPVILMIAAFRSLSLTIAYLCFLYPITAAVIFTFISWITQAQTTETRYLNMLRYQYRHNKSYSGILKEDIPALDTYLKQINSFTGKDWELMLKILTQVFPGLFDNPTGSEVQAAVKLSYDTIQYISDNIEDDTSKKQFIESLASDIETETNDSTYAIDALTWLLLPVLEITDHAGNNFYIMALSNIRNAEKRQELLMRGLVYTYYLEYLQYAETTNACTRLQSVRTALIIYTPEWDSERHTEYVIRFTSQLQEIYPDSGFNITHVINLL